MEQVEVDGLHIAYERAGHGPPVVLVHGYEGDARATWRRQIEGLSDEFTVVAWDAPGSGQSSDPPEFIGMAGYADCLAKFIGELGFVRVHVIGLSFGGALALELGRRHGSIPVTLTLASAYAGWGGSLPASAAEARLQQALDLSERSPQEFVDTLLPTMFSTLPQPADVDAFRASLWEFHPVGFRAMARACAEDLRGALPCINAPTLLIYGDRDERAPINVAEDLQASIAGATLVVLPGAGHVCTVETPDQFIHETRAFLHTHTG